MSPSLRYKREEQLKATLVLCIVVTILILAYFNYNYYSQKDEMLHFEKIQNEIETSGKLNNILNDSVTTEDFFYNLSIGNENFIKNNISTDNIIMGNIEGNNNFSSNELIPIYKESNGNGSLHYNSFLKIRNSEELKALNNMKEYDYVVLNHKKTIYKKNFVTIEYQVKEFKSLKDIYSIEELYKLNEINYTEALVILCIALWLIVFSICIAFIRAII